MVFSLYAMVLNAQNVGIGTTSPNASAQLDVSSSSKGFLLPRMTTTNRNGITSPANGLVVYDTTLNRLYQYQDGTWRYLLNNTYWVQSTTRNYVYNSGDSIGIGTTIPTQRLDVNGNIRSRDNLIADGTVSGGTLQTTGNLVALGTGIINGNISTNSDMIINNAGATLQLKNGSNVNTGFFQLAGDNVRLGTNSGNTAGDLVIRMDGTDRVFINGSGNVGIGDATPSQKLDVNGNINLTGKVQRVETGAANMVPVAYGKITANGTLYSGTGNFTIVREQTGIITLTSSAFTPSTVVIATPTATNITIGAGTGTASNTLTFYTRYMETGELINAWFNFVAYDF